MKSNMTNKVHIEGYLYSTDKLEIKTAGPNTKNPGVQFINGVINIATDNAITNIIPVHFTYVTPTFGNGGKPNATFGVLKDIVEGKLKTYMEAGVEGAAKLRIDSAIGVNDFYTDRNGQEELVSAKRNEGGFVHVTPNLNEKESLRSTFDVDMIITGTTRIEANEERGLPERVVVKGCAFDFRNSLLPVEFDITNPGGMNYFEGLGASPSNPVFTRVWGNQVSETVKRQVTIETAFGADEVREMTSNRKSWLITNANKDPYVFDDPSTITVDELRKCMQERETYLATVKSRQEAYKASKAAGSTPAKGAFNF